MPDPQKAFQIFSTQYEGLKDCYSRFFPALKDFAFTELTAVVTIPLGGEN